MRLDKWLWAARFFKARGLATAAVSGGKVHLNDARVKPAHGVRPGDRVRIQRGIVATEVEVRALADRRGPAAEAADLYEETADSRAARARNAAAREFRAAGRPRRGGRPSRQERRASIRFTRRDDR